MYLLSKVPTKLAYQQNQHYTFIFRLSTNNDVFQLKQPLFNFEQNVYRTTVIWQFDDLVMGEPI